ncbi:MFS transporter [Agarivorans sp. 1_MG-2023]|nr:MFS transporter [Agarivorans sp. 1_MG-2023]MDO6763543.1 MFS transporter [Agarivorans sp. 1_MG-2023]
MVIAVEEGLNPTEKRGAYSLALLFALRMAGLFMLMPVLAVYGQELKGFSPLWVGLSIGAYGLTQAMFQIPMGWLSDRIGRKPVIFLGLSIFALGSVVAAMAESIHGVAIGRALQGMGAIASTVMALAADLSRETQRAKVMAFIGVSIGLSFAASLVLGPIVSALLGLSGLFWLIAGLSLAAMLVVQFAVPNAHSKAPSGEVSANSAQMFKLLKHPQLLRLDWGVFTLHLVLTALFVVMPLRLVDAGLEAASHWQVYLPAVLVSFVLMVPLLIIAAKRNQQRGYFLFAISLLLLANALLLVDVSSIWLLGAILAIFFIGFNYLEASLPALISNLAPPGNKGAALGVFSTSQFLGAFIGGSSAGALYMAAGAYGVSLFAIALLLIWLVVSLGMRAQSGIKSYSLAISSADQPASLLAKLQVLPGVVEAVVISSDRTVYLKVKTKEFELARALDLVRAA